MLLLLLACHAPAPAPPPAPLALSDADGVAAADLDGDGFDDVILVSGGQASWLGHTLELGGGLQAVARGDVDGDGREEALLATGMSRDFRDAPARVWALDEAGGAVIWERSGERNQVADLRVSEGRVWVAAFIDARVVEGGWLEDGAIAGVTRVALGTQQLPTKDGVVVGRVYGDAPRSDGDLRLIQGDTVTTLPSFRGVRSLAAADLDGDGEPELLVGDGWHFAYGERAQGRVWLLEGPDWRSGRAVAQLGEEYSARGIEALDGRLLVTGTRAVHLLTRDALGWRDDTLGAVAETGNAVAVRTPAGPAALISGEPAQLVHFPR
ncbi:MAG: FG-GAP repeat protein [Alphaproteobacteria bacterium]|nr:FG-GAP repeat protein [Alphaproteobacteria bacterium]MCB9793833.1 FG-GAP repeat protein [Alphaproteobacteria bacterium]